MIKKLMKVCKSIIIIASIVILCTNSLIVPTQAADFGGNLSSGQIDIDVHQYTNVNGELKDARTIKNLLPGESVSYIVRVENKDSPAYVRVRLEFSDNSYGMNESWLGSIGDKWKKVGDWWYYTEPVESGGYADLCQTMNIPFDIDESDGSAVETVAYAQAVQAKNFYPDFDAKNDPWNGVEIEASVADGDFTKTGKASNGVQIDFDGTFGATVSKNELFSNFGAIMPGDSIKDHVDLNNNSGYTLNYMLYDLTDGLNKNLVDHTVLAIYIGDTRVYMGLLENDGARINGIDLGNLANEESQTINFVLYFDTKINNEMAFKNIPVKFRIVAKPVNDGLHNGLKLIKQVTDVSGKDLNESIIDPGSEVIYTLTVLNTSKNQKTVTLSDIIDPNVKINSASDNGVITDNMINWQFDIPANSAKAVTINCNVPSSNADIINMATLNGIDESNEVLVYIRPDGEGIDPVIHKHNYSTGDKSNLAIMIAATVVAVTALIIIIAASKKKKNNN